MSISITSFQNPIWKAKIDHELRLELESHTHKPFIEQPHGIYAHHEEQLVGGIIFQHYNNIIWIDGLWVEEKFKRQGIGTSLLEEVIKISKQQKVQNIQTNTYFPEAKHFLQSNGFEVVKSIPNWKYGLTCYLMRKYI